MPKVPAMVLYTRDSVESRVLETVAEFCQLLGAIKRETKHQYESPLLSVADPALQTELKSRISVQAGMKENLTLNHPRTIARYLARVSNNTILLGKGPLEEALADELLAVALSMDAKGLEKLQALAAKNTYLGSPSGPRLGDIAVYAALHPQVSAKKGAWEALPPALMRWFDLMQHHHTFESKDRLLSLVPIVRPVSLLFDFASSSSSSKPQAGGKKPKAQVAEKKKMAPKQASAGGNGGGGSGAKPKLDKVAKKAAKKAKLEAEAKARAAKEIGRVDFRVGLIKKAIANETDPTLYVSTVLLGDLGERQVVSRLGGHVALEELQERKVVVIVNLEEAEFGGKLSQGRIMCGTDKADSKKKSLVTPPPDAKVGERVGFTGSEGIEADPVVKDKRLRPVLKKLTVSGGTAMYANLPFNTSAGPCTCPGISQGTVA